MRHCRILLFLHKGSTKENLGIQKGYKAANERWSIENQKASLDKLGREKFGIKELDDWYNVKARDVLNEFKFIRKHHGSLHNALKTLYPEHNWDPLRFSGSTSAHRDALEKFGREELGVKELDDWYHVNAANVVRKLPFLKRYGSLYNTLKRLYPQHEWDPLRFSRVPHKLWRDENAHRDTLEKFGREQFGVKELDDWYTVPSEVVYDKLSFIRNYYRGSLFNTLKTLYPHHHWDPLRFAKVPKGYWTEDAQRDALERFGREELGVKELDDWYHVAAGDVHRRLSFVKKYGSLYDALKKLYPQHEWDPLRFSRVPSKYWMDENAHRDALERLGREKLGVKELDDWYNFTAVDIKEEYSFLKNYYNSSLPTALKKLYPHHNWDPLRFTRVSRGYWFDHNTHREALEKVGRELGVKELDDWYHVAAVDVRRELGFVRRYGSLANALKQLYPQHKWDPLRFSRVPNGYWQEPTTIEHYRNMFTTWKRMYSVQSVGDWYLLPPHQLQLLKRAAVGIFGGKMKMMAEWFPDTLWHSRYTSQIALESLIKHAITDSNLKHYRHRHRTADVNDTSYDKIT